LTRRASFHDAAASSANTRRHGDRMIWRVAGAAFPLPGTLVPSRAQSTQENLPTEHAGIAN